MQQQIGHGAGRRPARGRAVARQRSGWRALTRPWVIAAAVALVAVAAIIGAVGGRPAAEPAVAAVSAEMAPEVGKLAPTFTLATPDGTPVSLASLRGQVVLVNFWATWCPPCRAEMPAIQAAYAQYRARGFTVVAVTANEQPESVTSFFAERGLSFAALLDDGRVHAAYRASGLPSSFFVDRQGVVRAVYRGAMSDAVITGEVERLLAE